MADDDIDSGLFNISISDSEEDDVDISHGIAQGRDRKGQSEAQFQTVKRDYRPKVENGEISKSIRLPLGQQKIAKQEGQGLLHAVEELYFYRRYDDAVVFIGKVFDGGEGTGEGLDADTRDLLRTYEKKCLGKLGRNPT
ncbi:hypothetical protein VM1G_09781 [Cytospora mali]|uniref:Uncharacterized protein n=1 Tax=Cytospora mali TaxID=578113 RepID=A0A194WCT6_CYTMA|nr:hypothetical protein VM1G_09781 [Valsa mali]